MQFSKNWLKEFVDIKVSTEELCEQLTMLGLEVDDYRSYRSKLTGNDAVIKLDITPNRGDCFSILGVARELSALYGSELFVPVPKKIQKTVDSPITVKACKEAPSYVGRFIAEVDLKKKTPPLIKERLKLSDVRTIDPIVDITNYVLLELGQPLHAFDIEKLSGNLNVRFSSNEEKIILLDEQEIELDDKCLVIADEETPVAFAGIMGGLNTGVTSKTKSIFLESAFFVPEVIRGKTRKYGIQTDASLRFERGVDFKIQTLAVNKASLLINEVMGCKFGPVQLFQKKTALPKNKLIYLNPLKTNSLLGSNLTKTSIIKTLRGLGLEILSSKKKNNLKVKVPSWRFDLDIEADLIEEIARLIGYNNLPQKSLKAKRRKNSDSLHLTLRKSFLSLGYNEVITYSFIDYEEAKLLTKKEDLVLINNPISEAMSVMRPSLLSGLLKTFSYNYNRSEGDLKIFEIGSVFHKKNKSEIFEKVLLGGLISGQKENVSWSRPQTEVDFYDLKGDLETIFNNFSFRKGSMPFLHEGKTALIFKEKKQLGYMGALSPKIKEKLDIKQDTYFFELSLESLLPSESKKFKRFSHFPLAQRDLSFFIDSDVEVKEVMDLIILKSGKDLKEINIFDVYEGQGVPKGKKGLTFSLSWQATNRTMTDLEIDHIVEKIVGFLSVKLNARLRS